MKEMYLEKVDTHKTYTYEQLPKKSMKIDGMKVIQGDKDNIRVKLLNNDIEYIIRDNEPLHLRFLYPDELYPKETYPIYIHIKGSAYLQQDLNDILFELAYFVKKGYIVAIVEYRPADIAMFPAQVEDARAAIHYIYDHAQQLKVDKHNIFLGGDSSGGHVCSLVYATSHSQEFDNRPLPPINAFIDLFGPYNFQTLVDQIKEIEPTIEKKNLKSILFGKRVVLQSEELMKQTNPITYLDDQTYAPLLIMHGNKDRRVPFMQSVDFYQKLKSKNKDVTFYCVDDGNHGGTTFYTEGILDIIYQFLQKNRSFV